MGGEEGETRRKKGKGLHPSKREKRTSFRPLTEERREVETEGETLFLHKRAYKLVLVI